MESTTDVLFGAVPPAVAGAVAGFLAQRGTTSSANAGAAAGMLAAVPVVALAAITLVGDPSSSGAIILALIVFASLVVPALLLVVAIAGTIGLVTGVAAGRVAQRFDTRHREGTP